MRRASCWIAFLVFQPQLARIFNAQIAGWKGSDDLSSTPATIPEPMFGSGAKTVIAKSLFNIICGLAGTGQADAA